VSARRLALNSPERLGSYIPCDQIQTSEVTLNSPHLALLKKALEGLGFTVTLTGNSLSFRNSQGISGTFANGSLKLRSRGSLNIRSQGYASSEIDAGTIKQAYSKELVGYAAKQFGWKLSEAKASAKRGVAFEIKARK
jgi:hypothetical protein